MSTEEDDDEKGMDEAVERARAKGGADTFGAVASVDQPELGPVEPPPPTPADVAPEPEPPPDAPFAEYAPTTAPPPDDTKRSIADALRGITERRYTPSAAVSDDAIAKARSDRQSETKRNDMTRAISSWLMRKPYEPTPPEDAASQLLAQRRSEQGDFERNKAGDISASSALARALKGEKPSTDITPYQSEELKLRRESVDRAAQQKSAALADRKRTMLSQYPEYEKEINALSDLGDAQTLQTALEGRLGRKETQTHSDTAAEDASRRSLNNSIALDKYKSEHQPLTAEQKTQLEGIEKSDAALDSFEKALASTSGVGRVGASTGKLGGALGLPGASFDAAREGTAVALARGLEGGMARPGNVEVILKVLPLASDDEGVKRQKMMQARELVRNNREAFAAALQQGGASPLRPGPVRAPTQRPAGVPANAKFNPKTGNWVWLREDGVPASVPGK